MTISDTFHRREMESAGFPNKIISAARIVVVDDHPVVRQGLVLTLGRMPGLSVCGEASTAPEALVVIANTRPDIVIADLDLEGASGIELVKTLRAEKPALPVLILSMHDEVIYAERVLRAGARGFLMKSESPESIADGVRSALKGDIILSKRMNASILGALTGVRESKTGFGLERLTDRELEVFRMIGEGLTTRMLAERLSLSQKTIEAHIAHIKTKLGAESGRKLQRRAFAWSIGAGAPNHQAADPTTLDQ